VLHYRDGSVIEFVQGGVSWLRAEDFARRLRVYPPVYPDGTWALVDTQFTSESNPKGTPSGDFLGACFFVVLTTPPEEDRYSQWQTQAGAKMTIMKPWSWEEYSFAA
jgi:hypothetical protein